MNDQLVLDLFRFQAEENPVYHQYLKHLGQNPLKINTLDEIPFLPIEFFRTHRVVTGTGTDQLIFESSGTTGSQTSRHYVLNENLYHNSLETGFRLLVGNPTDFCILALLPSYLERSNSSLVYMVDRLMKISGDPDNGFFLDDLEALAHQIRKVESTGRRILLIGVSFALIDLAEQFPMKLENTTIIETGGMKGRREELTRKQLHQILTEAFTVPAIGSEYGMTELLSQAWSGGHGLFRTPPTMKVLIRDPYNPFRQMPTGKTGGIDIIDLANRNSCSFIQTQDLGRAHPDGTFEVLGRFDSSAVRGCNLLY
ncbi:MAG: acyltransferase [Bacteroidales bacterium]|jgi:phenylacetate-coenzyme A ligase PaaK-like adenylate-forming protein|nr:acyltransferase [Bacteroidales bacterium]MDD2570654.1 acyltransferase [Bacteroidales bacterium]MDD3384648.1 acyltransferase [Bacteroidales bacterium]MDD3811468.1 acyltransferase [Bacteroidales bacterium]MDD3871023.1 acyltransferase [Bacteroidales bacterium]